jgi:hypothetical protein
MTPAAPPGASERAVSDDRVESARPEMDDKPPLLGSWRNIYAVVLGTLAIIIVVCALITRAYA